MPRKNSLVLPFAAMFITSCAAGTEQAFGEANGTVPKTSVGAPDTTGQLAEYVVDAFVDSKGTLWFGTIGHGIARYDGSELTYLSPAGGAGGNVVSSIAEDKAGNLWFAGHDGTGICRYHGNGFTRIWDDESTVATDAHGNIWASTRTGVHRFDGERMVPFHLPLDRSAITEYAIHPGNASFALEDSKGNLWFRTDGAGAYRYDGKNFTQYTKKDGLCSNTVNAIIEDDSGTIWFICMQAYQPKMTGDGGLCRYDGDTFTTFPEVDGLHNNDLYTLFKDREGNIWIGATGHGAYRYDGATFTLINTTDRPDLNGSFGLQAMAQDGNGTFWCGFSGGLFRSDGTQFVNVRRDGPWK